MADYQPFLIADFKGGLRTDREPWLLPQDAFEELSNCYIDTKGVLQNRVGYVEYADTDAANPIVGLMKYVEDDGTGTLMVADTKRLYEYSAGTLTDIDGVDVWTGDAGDLLSWVNWQGSLYMANGVNVLRAFDGTSAANVVVDVDGDSGNDVSRCRFVAVSHDRLIIFRMTESGGTYNQRARWCAVGNPADWTNDEYLDAPTSEWIRGVGYINDDVVVWFDNSVWLLRYTGDSDLPFLWQKIDGSEGCKGELTVTELDGRSVALGVGGLVSTDGTGVQRLDVKIPNYTLEFNQDRLDQCFGQYYEAKRQLWVLYPSTSATTPDKALILNYDNGTWATYTMPMTCLGTTFQATSERWVDALGHWDAYVGIWNDRSFMSGYPLLIGGNATGQVYQLEYGGVSDDVAGSVINPYLVSSRWNPYKEQGLMAKLGHLEFLMEAVLGSYITVEFFLDWETATPYLTAQVATTGTGLKWYRLFSGAVGTAHRIKISSGWHFKIHAIQPYFRPAGRNIQG